MATSKTILIIVGPNGAGKTTFARRYLLNKADSPTFINADLIAEIMNPSDPESVAFRAGREMLRKIDEHVRRGENFAFETTLSGRAYAKAIPAWQAMGYTVHLSYLRLPNAETAVSRVQNRVLEGGHHVDEGVVRRRFESGFRNFYQIYQSLVDTWALYDSSDRMPTLISEGRNNERDQ